LGWITIELRNNFPFSRTTRRSSFLTANAIVLASSLLAVLLALALVREVRWRRALQKLVHRIFTLWRKRHEEDMDDDNGGVGRRIDGDRRLRR
jgi:hypothetical protein